MDWKPNIKTFDGREVNEQLLGFISANNRIALDWADGEDLPIYLNLYNSARVVSTFPTLLILQSSQQQIRNDFVIVRYAVVFEGALQSGDQQQITIDAKKYVMALESMLNNVPETTLFQNSIIDIVGEIGEVQTEYDVLQSRKNSFIQIFQTKADWEFRFSAY